MIRKDFKSTDINYKNEVTFPLDAQTEVVLSDSVTISRCTSTQQPDVQQTNCAPAVISKAL